MRQAAEHPQGAETSRPVTTPMFVRRPYQPG